LAKRQRKTKQKKEDLADKYLINEEIQVPEIRLVGEFAQNGNQIISTDEALKIAEESGLDLVMIAPNANPPVCKIIDFQKFLYEEKKRLKEIKSKADKVEVKEIRFTPTTDEHDFNFKVRHVINFLEQGKKVKAYVFFKGRMIVYKDSGRELLDRLLEAVSEYGQIEQEPKMEGRRMSIIIAPKKKKKH